MNVVGHASKFLCEPQGSLIKDAALRNSSGTVVPYVLNAVTASRDLRINFHSNNVATPLHSGAVTTYGRKP